MRISILTRALFAIVAATALIECSGAHSLPTSSTTSVARRGTHIMSISGCPVYPDGSVAVLDTYNGIVYFLEGPISSGTAPSATITLPYSSHASQAGMTFDPSGNLWIAYAATFGGFAVVLEYAAPLTTGESPSITISGSNTGFEYPNSISFNPSTNDIYVGDSGTHAIDVFSDTANGNVAPSAVISGSNTGLSNFRSLKTDANYIYAPASVGGLLEFTLSASGNVSPNATIASGSNIGTAFDFDTAKDVYSSPGSEMWIYPPVNSYSYSHGQYDGPSLAAGIVVDASGFIYGVGSGDSLYVFDPINWSLDTGTMTAVTVGSGQNNALAVYSPGKFTGTEPQ
jgi:hypothetical protein